MSVRAALLAACLAGVAVAVALGGTWSDRLSDPRGFHLVPVRDAVAPPVRAALAPRLPRRAVIVVIDGLGFEDASGMPALAALRARGQCLRTYVGAFSVSQPVYTVLSTGLEQDRTGVRNNEPIAPPHAESLWRVARQAGLSVSGISELTWWRRLFPLGPEGFSTYVVRPRAENFFAQAPPADLMIIHPTYVDEAGHDGGAASVGYRQAVARADAELTGLVASLDPGRDLLLVTADHGHTLRGGHGGAQPRVTHVLTCYAGPGVRRSTALGEMQATSVAPSLALLLGLRFPAHMRAGADAGDDDLDVLWRLADPAVLPAEYLADRRQAVARFREENRGQLQRWPGGDSGWGGFYARHREAQRRRIFLAAALALVALGLLAAFPGRPPARRGAAHPPAPARRALDAVLCVAWIAAIYLVIYVLTVVLRGSFDATAVNKKGPFMRFGVELSAAVLTGAGLLHLWLRRSLVALRADVLALLVLTLALSLGHPAVFGWHLGFPIPPSEFIYFPYFAALFLFTLSVLALPLCLDWPRRRARS